MGKLPHVRPYEFGSEVPLERAHEVARDSDTFKIPEISFYDIDYAVLWHLENGLKIAVTDKGQRIQVPALYAAGERWAQIRKHGYIRDQTDRVLTPLISIRRSGVAQDERIPQLNTNHRKATIKVYPDTVNSGHDQLGREFYIVSLPRFIRLTYDLYVWTQTTEQCNEIIQKIEYAHNHVWGDLYKFRTQVQGSATTVETPVGGDRIVSAQTSLLVDAYLRQEEEYHVPSVVKAYTINKISLGVEVVSSIDDPLPSNPVEAYSKKIPLSQRRFPKNVTRRSK